MQKKKKKTPKTKTNLQINSSHQEQSKQPLITHHVSSAEFTSSMYGWEKLSSHVTKLIEQGATDSPLPCQTNNNKKRERETKKTLSSVWVESTNYRGSRGTRRGRGGGEVANWVCHCLCWHDDTFRAHEAFDWHGSHEKSRCFPPTLVTEVLTASQKPLLSLFLLTNATVGSMTRSLDL